MRNLLLIGTVLVGVVAGAAATSADAQRRGDYGYDYGSDQNNLTLICWGEGRRPTTAVQGGYAWDSRRHRFVPRTYLQNTTREFDSEVQVELHDDWGRIHLTGRMIPPIHSGGNNGWWDLEDVHVGPDTITARYRLNGLNRPRVNVDRRTGRIRIDGIEDFRGECEQGNWGERENRF